MAAPGGPMKRSERIAAIRTREAAATKGPWAVWRKFGTFIFRGIFNPEREHEARHRYEEASSNAIAQVQSVECAVGDAEFIANARADIPWLLAQLAKFKGLVTRAQRLVDHADHCEIEGVAKTC